MKLKKKEIKVDVLTKLLEVPPVPRPSKYKKAWAYIGPRRQEKDKSSKAWAYIGPRRQGKGKYS